MFNRIRVGSTTFQTRRALIVTAAVMAGWSLVPRALYVEDAVLAWNQIAITATVMANQGPLPQSRSMTIVQVAVHDAVNGISGRHDTYLTHGPAPAGASPEAAAIAAAHRVLVTLFPAQAPGPLGLDAARVASLATYGLTEADPGIGWGESVAAAILASRANDGAAQAQFAYAAPGSGMPGVWVAIGSTPALLAGWGSVTPWVLRSGSQFRPDEPPSLTSGRYARDYNEIKEIGAANSTTRTRDQTEIGRFWLATPSAIWNHVARQVIESRGLDPSDTARAFALVYLAASDAGIACWDAKYTYNFWRPMAAIRNGEFDGNDATLGDSNWQPLFPTPAHPEYTSGHTTNSSAMGMMLAFLFGDNPGMPIIALSPTNPTFPRNWSSFSEGIDEVIDARVYSGIHYRTSDEVGARVGRQVARFVLNHALR
ncbi:MAG TPA: vanadium-dependent haloperoxidase [Vicinamibacterales bacterium]|jgi:hypothetical protein|nr:vanadium-dependent haloperoxidase [Vicinamibacterales bacterium]